ncbi:pantetheine-phosphate adenylyltransferase [bacterium]|nr:pantetheine-phosphate adenylyltransferase [bacterium]
MAGALYSGSFDPVTFGHLDIIRRASKAFSPFRVVVGNNPAKRYVFSLEERVRFLRHAIEDPRIEVEAIENKLLADHAYEAGFSVVVKGVRGIQDYDYERMMHEINITQQRGIETHVLLARRELAHVSSSAVKELCRYQGFTHEYVPPIVKEALERRLNEQVIVGVTGGIACGKSHLGRSLVSLCSTPERPVHDIDLDELAHEILFERKEPAYEEVRGELRSVLGLEKLERRELGNVVFADPAKLARLNETMRVPLLTRLRAAMAGKKGVILVNSALLAEAELLHLCNNKVVLVVADEPLRVARLRERGLSPEQIERRLACQFSTEEKLRRIRARIAEARWGRCEIVESNVPLERDALRAMLERLSGAP